MANLLIGYDNLAEGASLSGGDWLAGLPLAAMQSRELARIARSADAAEASTWFDVDLGSARPVRLLAFVNVNCSTNARIRLTAANDDAFAAPVHAVPAQDVFPVVYAWDVLEWEDDNWWSGRYAQSELAGLVLSFDIVLPATVIARYWRVEILDDGNADGFLQLGHLFMAAQWQPLRNVDTGASFGLGTGTEIGSALGGAEVIDPQPQYRMFAGTLSQLDEGEGFGRAFELMRRLGIGTPVYLVADPDDRLNAIRRNFLGRFSRLNPVVHRHAGRMSVDLEIREWTA